MSDSSDLIRLLSPDLLELGRSLARTFEKAGGNLLIVGGSVRDLLLRESPKELDLEAKRSFHGTGEKFAPRRIFL